MIRYYICICQSTARDIVIYLLLGIKCLLQIIALIFAFSIRKVNVKGLDDSPFVIASVYFVSICLAIAVVTTITLINYVNYDRMVISVVFFIASTAILLLTFVPKVSFCILLLCFS